jgi:hypothetical protein
LVLETFGGSFSGRLIELGHAIARNYSKARSAVRLISSVGQFRFTVSLMFQLSLAHTNIEPCHPGGAYFLSPPTLPGATCGDHDPSSHTFQGLEASDHHILKREHEKSQVCNEILDVCYGVALRTECSRMLVSRPRGAS